MAPEQRQISVRPETFDRLEAHKREGETWDGVLRRAEDALSADGEGRVNKSSDEPVTVAPESVTDIADAAGRRAAEEIEGRFR